MPDENRLLVPIDGSDHSLRALALVIKRVASHRQLKICVLNVQLASSQVRLRIEVSDATLAMADEVTRNNAATSLVSAAEHVLASHPEYAKLQAISVAIIHPAPTGATGSAWHIEDVVEFRKGPNQRFFLHTT